jgi:superfamily II DNA helicase RecQ
LNANVNSCILNDETIIATLLNEIKTKTYIYILTSSKLALFNVFFRKILQIFEFCDRICFVVIDEIHLMKNWFNWRSKYDRFCELRSILSRIIFFSSLRSLSKRVNRETHQEVEIQRECEAYTRIDESKKNILQRLKYSRCFHRQFRRSSFFDCECQSIIKKNHFVWRKNSNAYRCETNVD